MAIKDKEGNVRIKFSNYKKINNSIVFFINVLVEITVENFAAKEFITVELSDFEEFLKDLKILNDTLKHTFYFQHLDKQFQLKFDSLITGNIAVTGFIKDKLYINALNFSFEMPPTELSHLIRENEDLITDLKK